MSLLYSRHETDKEIIITLTRSWLVYAIFFFGIILYFLGTFLGFSLMALAGACVAITGALVSIFGFWRVNREIRKAFSEGRTTLSGSKFSRRNAQRVVIQKVISKAGSGRE